jgi:hypothetical protein
VEPSNPKIYHRGDCFGIAAVPGFKNPVVVLESDLVTHLGRIWHAANARLATVSPGQGFDAARDLCGLLAPIFRHFGASAVEHRADGPLPRETKAILLELDEIAKRLEEFDPDNWPGGDGKA